MTPKSRAATITELQNVKRNSNNPGCVIGSTFFREFLVQTKTVRNTNEFGDEEKFIIQATCPEKHMNVQSTRIVRLQFIFFPLDIHQQILYFEY